MPCDWAFSRFCESVCKSCIPVFSHSILANPLICRRRFETRHGHCFRRSCRKEFDLDRCTDAGIQTCFAVVSTKGMSAGSVAGDGLMASSGRAPMLSADYSFWKDPTGILQVTRCSEEVTRCSEVTKCSAKISRLSGFSAGSERVIPCFETSFESSACRNRLR